MDKELLQAQLAVLQAQKKLLELQHPKQIAALKAQEDQLAAQIKKVEDEIAKIH